MALPTKHIRHQLPVLATLGETALRVLIQSQKKAPALTGPLAPGPVIQKTIPPRDPGLIRDYVRHVGGDPSA